MKTAARMMSRGAVMALAVAVFASCAGNGRKGCGVETPTMGWNSYNTFNIVIDEDIIMAQADAMASSGLKDAGYVYLNIDDGYFGGRDPETGRLLIRTDRFPNGMKRIVDHIHSLGLKAGIYSDAGTNTCGNYYGGDSLANLVGLYGHDQQDCDMFFGELGFDFIKVDYCGGTTWQNIYRMGLDEETRYTQIHQAILNTGRKDVRLNVCRWDYPGTWVSGVASSWRISGDINCSWRSIKGIIDQSLYLSAYASPGHYNDMDMLEVGRTLTEEEDKTHFGMWCILSSPLIIGCDMTKMRPETFALLTNPDLIALNQDTLGLQAYVVKDYGNGTYVLAKDLEVRHGKTRAVALYNSSDQEQVISVAYSDLDLAGKIKVRDLYAQKEISMPTDSVRMTVPAHGTRIYRLNAEKRLERSLYEAETAFLSTYQELSNANAVGTALYKKDPACSGGAKASNLGRKVGNDLIWKDVYSKEGGEYELTVRIAETEEALQMPPRRFGFGRPATAAPAPVSEGNYKFFISVNGGAGNQISIDKGVGYTTITTTLKPGNNQVRIYADQNLIPDIDCMSVKKL